jgi:hypothetical protein
MLAKGGKTTTGSQEHGILTEEQRREILRLFDQMAGSAIDDPKSKVRKKSAATQWTSGGIREETGCDNHSCLCHA